MEDISRLIKSLASKILRKYPDVDSRKMKRFESLVEKLMKDGEISNIRIDTESKDILEELLSKIEEIRKEQDTLDEILDMFMVLLMFTIILIDHIEKNK